MKINIKQKSHVPRNLTPCRSLYPQQQKLSRIRQDSLDPRGDSD